jgi:hypothetical protein
VGDLFQPAAIDADHEQLKGTATPTSIRRENDPLPVGVEERCEVRTPQRGHLSRLRPVGVGHPELELRGPHQPLSQQPLVVGSIGGGLRVLRSPHDLRPIGREERSAVVPDPMREPSDVGAIHLHGIELHIAVDRRREDHPRPIGRGSRLRVVRPVAGHLTDITAVRIRGVELEVPQGPDIPERVVDRRRARRVVGKCRGIDDPLVALNEETAGGAPQPVRDPAHLRAIRAHHILLVASGIDRVLALKDQPGPIAAEVRFGIVATEGELPNVGQVCFTSHRLVKHF